MVVIEEVLWNIFTFYSLNGNPRDPSRLHSMALLKICKDIMAVDAMMTESPITPADLHLIYTTVLKNPNKSRSRVVDKSSKLDFDEFLSCLVRIAEKCYPSCPSQEAAMQQLLMDNVLPLAQRREPKSVQHILKIPEMEALIRFHEKGLDGLFECYVITADQLNKERNLVKATANIVRTFDDQTNLISEAKARDHIQQSFGSHIGYAEFMKFVVDFGLVNSLNLTLLDFGDIYLTVTALGSFTTSLRRIDLKEFIEALVRMALLAFRGKPKLSPMEKFKGLLMCMWNYLQDMQKQHMLQFGTVGGGGFNTYRLKLITQCELFCTRFRSAWSKDDFRNYLDPDGSESMGIIASSPLSPSRRNPGSPHRQPGNFTSPGETAEHSLPPPPPPPATAGAGDSSSVGKSSVGGGSLPAAAGAGGAGFSPAASLLNKLKRNTQLSTHRPQQQQSQSQSQSPQHQYDAESCGKSHHTVDDGNDTELVMDSTEWDASMFGADVTDNVARDLFHGSSENERLNNTLHNRIEKSDSFVVKSASDGGKFRIMINSNDRFNDGRFSALDVKKLIVWKPEIAAILYDSLVEEGIVESMCVQEGEEGDVEVEGMETEAAAAGGGGGASSQQEDTAGDESASGTAAADVGGEGVVTDSVEGIAGGEDADAMGTQAQTQVYAEDYPAAINNNSSNSETASQEAASAAAEQQEFVGAAE